MPSREAFYSLPTDTQEEWIADWEQERLTCKFHGGPLEECSDDEADWYPQRVICWPTAQLEAAKALFATQHEEKPFHDGNGNWSKERSFTYPFHYGDGVSIYLAATDENPDDDFLNRSVAAD